MAVHNSLTFKDKNSNNVQEQEKLSEKLQKGNKTKQKILKNM